MSQQGFLTSAGFMVPTSTLKSMFGAKLPQLFSKLTIVTMQKVGPPKVAKMYGFVDVKGVPCVVLPRTLIGMMSRTLKINILLPPPITAVFDPVEVYDNQKIIIEHLCATVYTDARITAGTAACILNLRAGMGKTFVAAGLMSRLGLKTLYIVPKRPLAMQAIRDLAYCGISAGGDIAKDPVVLVMVINSALNKPAEFFSKYSFCVMDEVHMYCSEKRRVIFQKTTMRAVLGMSGTTEDRSDAFDPIAHKSLSFDGIIRAEKIPGFTYEDVVFDCRAYIINYNGPPEHTQNLTHESTGRIFTHYMHNQFINDPYRLKLAVAELVKLYDWRGVADDGSSSMHNIYVFAEEIDILVKAKVAFCAELTLGVGRSPEGDQNARGDIVADMAFEEGLELFTGGLTEAEITNATKNARVLFSTYGYAGTGVSILKMSAILFLTPRKANMKQILARILRRGSDTSIPRVCVDIVDNQTALRYQLGARRAAYEYYGFAESSRKVKFEEVR